MKVNVTYFRPGGKFYLSAETTFGDLGLRDEAPLFAVWDEIRERQILNTLPGLVSGGAREDFIILVEVPEHPHNHPRLIVPTRLAS